MEKRVIIVHGWDGYPEEGWFPWLKKELTEQGFQVVIPQLPKPDEPRIKNWVPALQTVVGEVDEQTYFVGHSMGCQTIARFLETLPEGVQVGGAVFVAGFFKQLSNMGDDQTVQGVATEWLTTPLDLAKVKTHLPKSVAIFSNNDPYVPFDNQDDFAEKLGSEIVVLPGQKHFSGSEGTTTLPAALEAVIKLTSNN